MVEQAATIESEMAAFAVDLDNYRLDWEGSWQQFESSCRTDGITTLHIYAAVRRFRAANSQGNESSHSTTSLPAAFHQTPIVPPQAGTAPPPPPPPPVPSPVLVSSTNGTLDDDNLILTIPDLNRQFTFTEAKTYLADVEARKIATREQLNKEAFNLAAMKRTLGKYRAVLHIVRKSVREHEDILADIAACMEEVKKRKSGGVCELGSL